MLVEITERQQWEIESLNQPSIDVVVINEYQWIQFRRKAPACCDVHEGFRSILPTGLADAAEEEGAVHRGRVPQDVQQQEHAGHQGAAQQRCGGGAGGPAGPAAGRPAEGRVAPAGSSCRLVSESVSQ